MTKKAKGDTPGAKPLIFLAVIAAMLFAALVYYVKYGPTSKIEPDNPAVVAKRPGQITIEVPVPKGGGPQGTFDSRKINVPAGTDPVLASVNAFLEGSKIVQPEARLVEVKREQDNEVLNFSSNFNQTYGTDDEVTLIQGILRAVKANSDAKTVTFLAGGKPMATLGSIDLSGPQSIKEWLDSRGKNSG